MDAVFAFQRDGFDARFERFVVVWTVGSKGIKNELKLIFLDFFEKIYFFKFFYS